MLTVECLLFRDYRIIPGPMLRNTSPTPADEPQDTASYTRKLIMFPCSGVKCQAWLYLPKGAEEKPPIVVAAHGIGEWGAGPCQLSIRSSSNGVPHSWSLSVWCSNNCLLSPADAGAHYQCTSRL